MSNPMTTETDISERACQLTATSMEYNGRRDYAEIVRALRSALTASEKRVQELEPAAECWNALCSCDRIKIMGVAGLDSNSPDFATPRAHIGLELWTQHEAKGDAQDINGRDWFSRFMEKAVAAYRASGRTP